MQEQPQHLFHGHTAIILSIEKGSELYPLTKNNPIGTLPIANKKLIVYQLEQLQNLKLDCIIIVYNEESAKVRQFVQNQWTQEKAHIRYPHKILFLQVDQSQSEYKALQKVITQFQGIQDSQGIIIMQNDLISSYKISSIFEQHEQKQADLTMFLKQKKQFGKDEKKPQFDFEPHTDIVLIKHSGDIYALRDIDDYEYSGFSIPPSVYKRISRASFQKVIDSRVYIINNRVIKIIKNLVDPDINSLKIDFIDTLISHQTNSTLLDLIGEKVVKPLKIVGKVVGQNQYVRRVSNLKIYQMLCLDGLIRGPKQKQILMPNKYTEQIDQKMMMDFKGCLIGSHCQIQPTNKMTRSMIQKGCKISKNVQISNSIVMSGTIVEQGCKILNSIVGPNCHVKSQALLSSCSLAGNVVVKEGTSNEKQLLIPQ